MRKGVSLSLFLIPLETMAASPDTSPFPLHLVIIFLTLLLAVAGALFYWLHRHSRATLADHVEQLTQHRDELIEVKQRLKRMHDYTFLGYWEWEIESGELYWSEEIYRLFGLDPNKASITSRQFMSALYPEDRALVRDKVHRAMVTGGEFDVVHRIIRPDGEIRYVHESGRVQYGVDEKPIKLIGSAQDVTELKRTESSLQEKTLYLDSILKSTSTLGIVATDPDLNINYINETARVILRMPENQDKGMNINAIHQRQGIPEHVISAALETAREEGEYRFSMEQKWRDTIHHIESRISPIIGPNKKVMGYLLLVEDMTEAKRAAEMIERQANYDPLTDLPNRRLLMDRLQQVLAQCKRHGHIGALLFFDLDNFKHINDSLGHPVGDQLLTEVAVRMKQQLREEDTIARLGGDEFVVLVSEIDDDTSEAVNIVQNLAEKIRETISESYDIEGRTLHITPSIGIALFPMGEETPTDVLRYADTAMYRAKESGRNAYRFFLPSMQLAADDRLKLINDLREAENRNELAVYLQPQINTLGEIVGAEALLRWNHPEHGFVAPDHFIHLAEESKQIISIGSWVLATALREFDHLKKKYPQIPLQRVAVNVSPVQFKHRDFALIVEQTLSELDISPKMLTLEVTEGMLVDDLDSLTATMDILKGIGLRFSIDDFGTGYSSLKYLKRLPLDELKIDKSFVSDVLRDANDAKIVETIITMARHLGMSSIAEGVERREELEFLQMQGCQYFQGYYFSRPLPLDAFERYLESFTQRLPGSVIPLLSMK